MRGAAGEVAHNLFVNKQRVVNHYSLGAGNGTKIHHNQFRPEQGSAILVYSARDTEIYENDFTITASPPRRSACRARMASTTMPRITLAA